MLIIEGQDAKFCPKDPFSKSASGSDKSNGQVRHSYLTRDTNKYLKGLELKPWCGAWISNFRLNDFAKPRLQLEYARPLYTPPCGFNRELLQRMDSKALRNRLQCHGSFPTQAQPPIRSKKSFQPEKAKAHRFSS